MSSSECSKNRDRFTVKRMCFFGSQNGIDFWNSTHEDVWQNCGNYQPSTYVNCFKNLGCFALPKRCIFFRTLSLKEDLLAKSIAANDEFVPVDENDFEFGLIKKLCRPQRIDENVSNDLERFEKVLLGR